MITQPRTSLCNPPCTPGTSHNGGYNHETVVYAIRECGYRLIDTAKRYGTETFVSQGGNSIGNIWDLG